MWWECCYSPEVVEAVEAVEPVLLVGATVVGVVALPAVGRRQQKAIN